MRENFEGIQGENVDGLKKNVVVAGGNRLRG